MADRTGAQFGQYRLIQRIGHGGYAEIYLGQHIYLPRQAALKILTANLSEGQIQTFMTEAQVLATLNHPHIIRLLDFAIEVDEPYLVMEYAARGSLRALYPHGTILPLSEVVGIVEQVADALQYAHKRGLIHRDIKPENMLVGADGAILLSDFGISVIEQTQTSDLLSNQSSVGTPTYMAPEQILGHPRRASDQYALAVVVYEWLCGKPPFSGAGLSLAMQHVHNEIPDLQQRAPDLPTRVAEVVMRALHKVPEERFPDVEDFAHALQQAAGSATPISAASRSATPHPSVSPLRLSADASIGQWSPSHQERTTTDHSPTFHNDLTIQVPPTEQRTVSSSHASPVTKQRRTLLTIGLMALLLLLITGLVIQLPITITTLQNNAHATATAQGFATATAAPQATATAAAQGYQQATSRGTRTGFDMAHSGLNPYEQTLTPDTVSRLTLRWSFPTNAPIASSPTVANNIVYIGSDDKTLYALNAVTGQQLWKFAAQGKITASPLVANGVVYIGALDHHLYALDAASGEKRWMFTAGGDVYSSAAIANNIIYVGATNGKLYAIDAQSGQQLWVFSTHLAISSSPSVANGIVYIGSWDNGLYAIDAQSGEQVWKFAANGIVHATPAIVDGTVYVGSTGGKFYAIDAQSGQARWHFSTGSLVLSSPAVANGLVYVGSQDQHLYAIDITTGQQRWSFLAEGTVGSSPLVANGVVYIGSDDHHVYAFDASTGKQLWTQITNGAVGSSPAVANGFVYVGSQDKALYAFALATP